MVYNEVMKLFFVIYVYYSANRIAKKQHDVHLFLYIGTTNNSMSTTKLIRHCYTSMISYCIFRIIFTSYPFKFNSSNIYKI